MSAFCEEFENSGWRRVRAFAPQGVALNRRTFNASCVNPACSYSRADAMSPRPVRPMTTRSMPIESNAPNQSWIADHLCLCHSRFRVWMPDRGAPWVMRSVARSDGSRTDIKAAVTCINRHADVFIIPIATGNMRPWHIANPCFSTDLSAPWVGLAIPTTTQWPKAS